MSLSAVFTGKKYDEPSISFRRNFNKNKNKKSFSTRCPLMDKGSISPTQWWKVQMRWYASFSTIQFCKQNYDQLCQSTQLEFTFKFTLYALYCEPVRLAKPVLSNPFTTRHMWRMALYLNTYKLVSFWKNGLIIRVSICFHNQFLFEN